MNKKIIDKIKKLLRLAESADVHEAANAAGQAQRMMEAHHIDAAMVALDEDAEGGDVDEEKIREFEDGDALHAWGRLATWKLQLGWSVASANGCRTFQSSWWNQEKDRSMRTMGIVGRPSDVATVRYLFAYLMAEIDRLCKIASKGKGRTWSNNFRLGAVHEIRIRLFEAKRQARADARAKLQSDTKALVRLDQALARIDARRDGVDAWMKAKMNLRSSPRSSHSVDAEAWHEGRRAGRDIDLGTAPDAAIGASNKALGTGE